MKGGKRPGAGRPPSTNGRTVKQQIRWTEAEWQEVGERAKGEGVTVSEYVRGKALK